MNGIRCPALYRKLSEPFASSEAVNEAFVAFIEELRALREKHKLADVHVIVSGNMLARDGEEIPYIVTGHQGDTHKIEAMCAYSQGLAAADRQQETGRLMSQAIKRGSQT